MTKIKKQDQEPTYLTLGGIPIRKLSDAPIRNKRIYDGKYYQLEDVRIFMPHGNLDSITKFAVSATPDYRGILRWERDNVLRHDLQRAELIPSSLIQPND
jgi:hypothetical protein